MVLEAESRALAHAKQALYFGATSLASVFFFSLLLLVVVLVVVLF